MTKTAADAKSGKGHTDENFPVASRLIHPRHRGAILAFYRFVRAADDVADHADLSADEKLRLLDGLEAALLGTAPADPDAEPLRRVLADREMPATHAQHLLEAFRLDARKSRTRDWADLIHYCSLSAMPVGRFVLDVHGESRETWVASDPLCAALQVINHLQDCGKDFRDLDRIYLPDDALARHGARVEELGAGAASPALLAVIRELAERSAGLLDESRRFPGLVRDSRLGLEVAVIQSLAEALVGKLRRRDPLRDRVHAGKAEALFRAFLGVARGAWQRSFASPPSPGGLSDSHISTSRHSHPPLEGEGRRRSRRGGVNRPFHALDVEDARAGCHPSLDLRSDPPPPGEGVERPAQSAGRSVGTAS